MERDAAVSPVLSESLLIALVLILVPIVTISLMNQLPEDRVPTVTIKMTPLHDSSVQLYHKGGDWIRKEDIRIYVDNQIGNFSVKNLTFDLGDPIPVYQVSERSEIRLIAKNSVVFTGVAHT